jgi:hypothetical protein
MKPLTMLLDWLTSSAALAVLGCTCRKNKVVPAQIHEIQAVMLDNLAPSRGGAGEAVVRMDLALTDLWFGCKQPTASHNFAPSQQPC